MLTRRAMLAAAPAAVAVRANAQPTPEAFARFREGMYLPLWRAFLQAGPRASAQFASFVGAERLALANAAPTVAIGTLGREARAQDAITRIVAAAAGRRVVMLNEAHVASRHRLFLAQLLRALRPLGFTHLAAEAFSNTREPGVPDISGYRAGAPFRSDYGFYTADPVFAEAVREAAELGYRMVAYERRPDQDGPSGEDSAQAIARREEAQSENLLAFLRARPDARVLVFVGYSHLREKPDSRGNVWFAERLKTKGGPDPLTIEQSATGSFGPHAPDAPLTREVLARFSPERPIVVEDETGVLGAERAGADLAVFHPSLPDVEGRPGWLAADPKRKLVRVPLPRSRLKGLVLVQAVHAGDPPRTVPADQYLPPYGRDTAVFLLRPGRYRLRLETEAGLLHLQSFAA